jgi:hypothetical protein
LHDGWVGAGFQGCSVAVQVALTVDEDLFGGAPLVTGWVAMADSGQNVARFVEIGWAEQFGQPIVETAD